MSARHPEPLPVEEQTPELVDAEAEFLGPAMRLLDAGGWEHACHVLLAAQEMRRAAC